MLTKDERLKIWKVLWTFAFFMAIIVLLFIISDLTFAESTDIEVIGKVYEFDKDSHYEFHEGGANKSTGDDNTYGTFFISGILSNVSEKSGVPSYEVTDGNLGFYYNYNDALLNSNKDDWHLVNDKSNKVADMKLDSDIMNGVIILQTSKDRMNWVDAQIVYNAFSDTPIRKSSIYSTTDVQLINGCYYRVVVAYKLSIRTKESNFLFINTDKFDYKKCVEVYEFYASKNSGEAGVVDFNQTYSLGSKVRAKNFDGYFGEKTIDKGDIHYGWELGNFFVNGYTDKVVGADANVVFLKNVGDKVSLWFNLNQNINRLNGKENLSVTADTEGYDQYFETPKMNFGRGVLIIRHTDHNNMRTEPTIYTNYLEANAVVGVDTKVQLFEEGDYEVALNYEITSDELIDKIGHYRIFFKFSVRNGNCMVYPFDLVNGSELTNSSMTENGFRLDLANSRYLKINLKREFLKSSADGLVEDTRSNGPAKDGAKYSDEGIYTITVSNQYTGQFTTKKIYVGTNNILRAYMTTGLSIPEINNLLANGASISEDGTIQLPSVIPTKEPTDSNVEDSIAPMTYDVQEDTEIDADPSPEEDDRQSFAIVAFIGVLISILTLVGVSVSIRLKKQTGQKARVHNKDEGSAEQ